MSDMKLLDIFYGGIIHIFWPAKSEFSYMIYLNRCIVTKKSFSFGEETCVKKKIEQEVL